MPSVIWPLGRRFAALAEGVAAGGLDRTEERSRGRACAHGRRCRLRRRRAQQPRHQAAQGSGQQQLGRTSSPSGPTNAAGMTFSDTPSGVLPTRTAGASGSDPIATARTWSRSSSRKTKADPGAGHEAASERRVSHGARCRPGAAPPAPRKPPASPRSSGHPRPARAQSRASESQARLGGCSSIRFAVPRFPSKPDLSSC